MLFIKIMLFLTGMGAFSAIMWKKRIEVTSALFLLGGVLWLYICSMLQMMSFGWYVLLTASFCCWGGAVVQMIRKRQEAWPDFKDNFLTPGLAFMVVGSFILYHFTKLNVFSGTDEFSHWGRIAQHLIINNSLPLYSENHNIIFINYPPGTALLQYIFMRLNGGFSESLCSFALGVFTIIMLSSGLVNSSWKKPGLAILYGIAGFLLPMLFNNNYYLFIMVDGVLGVLFGYTLSYAVLNAGKAKSFALGMILLLPMLFLVKQSGFGLGIMASIAGVVLAVKCWLEPGTEINKIKQSLWYVSGLATLILAKLSWMLYLLNAEKKGAFTGGNISLGKLYDAWVYSSPRHTVGIFEVWNKAIIGTTYWDLGPFSVSFCTAAMFFFALMLAMAVMLPKGRQKLSGISCAWITGVGFWVYAFTLYVYYCYEFTIAEASQLAGFDRYMGTFITAQFAALFIMAGFLSWPRLNGMRVMVCALPLMFYPGLQKGSLRLFSSNTEACNLRRNPFEFANWQLSKVLKATDKSFGMADEDGGALVPCAMEHFWGKQFIYKNHVFSAKTKQPVEKFIEEYTDRQYFYLFNVGDDFKQRYAECFADGVDSIHRNALYEVTADKKLLWLKPADVKADFENCLLFNTNFQNRDRAKAGLSSETGNNSLRSYKISLMPKGHVALLPQDWMPENLAVNTLSLAIKSDGPMECRIYADKTLLYKIEIAEARDWREYEIKLSEPSIMAAKLKIDFALPESAENNTQIWVDDIVLKFMP